MCGRFVQERSNAELAELFDAEPLIDDPGGHYNLAPTDQAAVVVQRGDRRGLTAYRWGLVPHWGGPVLGGCWLDQCPIRDDRDEPDLPRIVRPATLPGPGRRLL